MNRREALASAGALVLCGDFLPGAQADDADTRTTPAMNVGVGGATRDKPQSKLWFARGHWWACLPVRGGNSVWQRTPNGWARVTALDKPLQGLTGQADVWADEDGVRTAILSSRQLATAGLRFDNAARQYVADEAPVIWQLEDVGGKRPESATITRDGQGRWWIAYDQDRRMWVRASLDAAARKWTEPFEVGGPAAADDICAITTLPGAVGVLWSDQSRQAFYFRRHLDGDPPQRWQKPETAAEGNRVADDHINIAVAPDGTLYAATKNSVDRIDQPQQGLLIRRPSGQWEYYPYAPLLRQARPTRPIALLGGDPMRLFLCHTAHGTPAGSIIEMLVSDARKPNLNQPAQRLIAASAGGLNDATSCKAILPTGQPWIVAASDRAGNIYEGVLPS